MGEAPYAAFSAEILYAIICFQALLSNSTCAATPRVVVARKKLGNAAADGGEDTDDVDVGVDGAPGFADKPPEEKLLAIIEAVENCRGQVVHWMEERYLKSMAGAGAGAAGVAAALGKGS